MHAAIAVISQEHRSIAAVISALEYLARAIATGGEPDYEVSRSSWTTSRPSRIGSTIRRRIGISSARCGCAARPQRTCSTTWRTSTGVVTR